MERISEKVRGAGKKAAAALAGMAATLPFAATAFADATEAQSQISSQFSILLQVITSIVTAIGAIVLLWGFFEWGTAMQSQDGVAQSHAFKRIAGGLVMILAPQLISAFITI